MISYLFERALKDVVFVMAVSAFKLLLEFEGGEYRVFDFDKYSQEKGGLVKQLRLDKKLFESVKVDGTGTICWDNEFDIAVEYLYNMSSLIQELSMAK